MTSISDNPYTQLFDALMGGDVNKVREVLDQNPNIDMNTYAGRDLPLHLACVFGDLECAKLLIERGADVLAEDYDAAIPFHYACKDGWMDLVNYFIDDYGGMNPDDVNIMLNAHDADGYSPLHYAATSDSAELVKLLLEKGACPIRENRNGKIPSEICTDEEVKKILNAYEEEWWKEEKWKELSSESEEYEEKLSAQIEETGNYLTVGCS